MTVRRLPKSHKPIDHLKGAITSVVMMSAVLLANVIQSATVLLRPINMTWVRQINRFCALVYWGLIVLWGEKLFGIRYHIKGDAIPEGRNVMLIANHQQMTDIPVLMSLAWRKKRLQHMKWFVKDILKWVPGPGWGMVFLDCIFLKRTWAKDRHTVTKTFEKLKESRMPFWLISFVEGTRITQPKLEKAQAFSTKRGKPILKNLLVPRSKGFTSTLGGMRDELDAVYEVTIGYPNGIPTLYQYCQGIVPDIHIYVRAYEMTSLPEDELELAQWLSDRYVEKDGLLEDFYRNGHF